MTLEPNTMLDHFRVVALIGRGGMADVYRAEDTRLGREVALKVLPPEFARDSERVARFVREVRAAASLSHAGIVPVHHVGEAGGLHYYAMALLPGGDLKSRVRAHPGGMPPAQALAVAAALARALDAAHARGIVHRDVKPENILFTADGAPQLTDFGIAHAVASGTRMTATGMSIGTPHYMSPEQAQGSAVDSRSDLYSLGVVLHELLTGRVPYDSESAIGVAVSHIHDPVPVLPAHLAAYQPLLDGLLAKSPDDRYASGEEVAVACEALARGEAAPVATGAAAAADRTRVLTPAAAGPRAPSGLGDGHGKSAVGASSPSRTRQSAGHRLGRSPLVAAAAGTAVALGAVALVVALRDSGPSGGMTGGGGGGRIPPSRRDAARTGPRAALRRTPRQGAGRASETGPGRAPGRGAGRSRETGRGGELGRGGPVAAR